MDFKDVIRTIPDYPKPGIQFRDITTLLGNPRAFRRAVDEMVQPWAGVRVDKVAGLEARGFILGGAVAHQLSTGFVPIRKKNKLPFSVIGAFRWMMLTFLGLAAKRRSSVSSRRLTSPVAWICASPVSITPCSTGQP